MATPPFKLAFFGDAGTEVVQGTPFYHDIGGYSSSFLEGDGEFAAAGPSVQAVSSYIHSQGPSDVVELGDLSYHTNASTLLDVNIGQPYNAFIYPYPSPLFVDPDGVYASQELDGAAATEGRTQWPYNLYNYPFGFPDSRDAGGAGGAKDRNRFWFGFGNHDYSSFLGDTDPNINYLLEEEVDLPIPGGSPLGPDVYQAKAVADAGGDVSAQRYGNTLQQLLDYFPWLSEDLEHQLRYLGVDAAALDDVSINVGRLDPTGIDGAYYSVSLGKDESGQPLVHIQFIDSTRLLSNAGYYKFFPSSPSEQPVLPATPDYSYNPADPSSASKFNRQNPFQGQQMLEWSKQDLAASKARWQVISPHHTTYGPAATFDNLTAKQYNTNPILISYISALNQSVQAVDADKVVDLVVNGDSHYYSRVLEQQQAPGGIGLGIPVMTLGNGGMRPATINLVPYGTPVDQPANLVNYKPDRNGKGKLDPEPPGLGMPETRQVSVGTSGYYSYTRNNAAPQGGEEQRGAGFCRQDIHF